MVTLIQSIQQTALDASMIPPSISIDQEGGLVARLTKDVTLFPGNMAQGATQDTDLATTTAWEMASELRAMGITMNFAPVVDVNSNPQNPIIGVRSFGSSPDDVAEFVTAFVAPSRDQGVVCVAKHFPGHGDTDVDSHLGLPIVNHDLDRLESVELAPFSAMVNAGVPM